MELDELVGWLLDEKAAADSTLNSLGLWFFETTLGAWERGENGDWTQPEIERYRGGDDDIQRRSGSVPGSRSGVQEFLTGQAAMYPMSFGVYPENPELHAEFWVRSVIGGFFRKIAPDLDVTKLAHNVADSLLADAHRDHLIVIEKVLMMRPEVGEPIRADEYVIRPPNGSDMELIRGGPHLPGIPTTWFHVFPQSVLEFRYEVPLDDTGYPSRLQPVLVGLMLADTTFATMTGSIRYADTFRNPGFGFLAPRGEKWNGPQPLDNEVLHQAVALANLYEQSDEGVKRAARRLIRSTEDFVDPSDRLVDTVITMESLLTHASRDQLSYQLRIFGALILGESLEERLHIRDELKAAYNERSSIVHSNEATSWPTERIDSLAGMARDLCRRFVERGRPDFDALILDPCDPSVSGPV